MGHNIRKKKEINESTQEINYHLKCIHLLIILHEKGKHKLFGMLNFKKATHTYTEL